MKSLLIAAICAMGFFAQANELNLANNFDPLMSPAEAFAKAKEKAKMALESAKKAADQAYGATKDAANDALESAKAGAKVLAAFGTDTFNKASALTTDYGPKFMNAAMKYGPIFVQFVSENQDKIVNLAQAIVKFQDSRSGRIEMTTDKDADKEAQTVEPGKVIKLPFKPETMPKEAFRDFKIGADELD
jgi:hypothetical protein